VLIPHTVHYVLGWLAVADIPLTPVFTHFMCDPRMHCTTNDLSGFPAASAAERCEAVHRSHP
jgi:hypothetical protein